MSQNSIVMKKEIRITIINQQILITFRILILRRLSCFNKNCPTSSTIYSLPGRSVVTTRSHYEWNDLLFCPLLINPESDSLNPTMYVFIPKGSCVVRNTNLLRRERFRAQAWPRIPTANKSLSLLHSNWMIHPQQKVGNLPVIERTKNPTTHQAQSVFLPNAPQIKYIYVSTFIPFTTVPFWYK